MLRSGTSLLERLLARHPDVAARGELNWLPRIAGSVLSGELQGSAAEHLRALYLRQLARGESGYRFYIDKNPLNFRYLGLIDGLFPESIVIHLIRDARDVGLSIYAQVFEDESNGYAYHPDDIVHYFRGYRSLMAHWKSMIPGRIISVRYESLVSDPEDVLNSLHEAMGLNSPPNMLADSNRDDAVRTASAWQARQPVHRGSVGRWKNYRGFAPDFFRALAEVDVSC